MLPAITLGLFQMTLIMRLVRAEMLEVLRSDYVKFARARGLSNRAINFGHALKNTLVPVITIIGLQIGGIIAFSIVTETVFQWPGMGLLFVQIVQVADIPVMAAYLMLISVLFVVINLSSTCSIMRSTRGLRMPRGSAAWRGAGIERARPRLGQRLPLQLPPLAGGAIVSALHPAGDPARGAFCCDVARAIQPVRPRQPQPDGQLAAARLPAGRRPPAHLLGTDDQGRDVLSADHVRRAISFDRRHRLGAVRGRRRHRRRAGRRLCGGAVDAVLMRVADVQLSFPSILIALLVDGVVSVSLPRDAGAKTCRSTC